MKNMTDILNERLLHGMTVRDVNYVLHGAQYPDRCWSDWGPVEYMIPDRDGRNLKTQNFICEIHTKKESIDYKLIDTKPYTPMWEFQGQEDARLVRWDGKLYATGVRRDDNTTGRGRMELMEISEGGKELSKVSIKAPDEDSYCEKNWMPVLDMPFHYIQLSNPTRLVSVNPKNGKCNIVVEKPEYSNPNLSDMSLRGSSQVIPWKDGHMAIVHTCELWLNELGRKYARYCHQFITWDKDWNINGISPLFSYNDYNIEFGCGMAQLNDNLLITFALQDNFSFLLSVPCDYIDAFINGNTDEIAEYYDKNNDSMLYNFFKPNNSSLDLWNIAYDYYSRNYNAASYCICCEALENELELDDIYNYRFLAARNIADLGLRDHDELSAWHKCINIDSSRPEAWFAVAMFYYCRNNFVVAHSYAKQAFSLIDNAKFNFYDPKFIENIFYQTMLYTEDIYRAEAWFKANGLDSGLKIPERLL